ncbi:MAG: SDR family oxidoreductase [Candidatus Pacearchaeota archaeon]|nr:SDR family oxidoreductase [Candidatus Pacearchaeota archaeon]
MDVKFNFDKKTAVITGASRGIGLAIANAFLENNSSVINISKSGYNPENANPRYTFIQENLNNTNGIEKIINNFEKKSIKVDFWINNAGVYPQSSLMDTSEEEWDEILSTNLKSLFFSSKFIARHMKKNGGGVILNASSFAAKMPSINSGIYAASKSAILSLTKSMAAEWAQYGIRVNSYSPGLIYTDMTKKIIDENKNLTSSIALSRCGSLEEVANVVLFLCSDASSYITGANIEINGGKFLVQNQGAL